MFGKKIDILTQDSCLFYDNQGVYEAFGGIVLAQAEGENIAKALGPKYKTCILQNHGLLTLGDTVDECVYLFSARELPEPPCRARCWQKLTHLLHCAQSKTSARPSCWSRRP